MTATLPPVVVQEFVTPYDIVSIQAVPPGMSGAAIFRCQSTLGQVFAIKRWPEGTTTARVAEVHRVQTCAHRNGCELVPQLNPRQSGAEESTTFAEVAGAIWELAEWKPGSPLEASASLAFIQAGATAIGHFHNSVRKLASQTTTKPPAVVRRLDRVRELDTLLPRAITATTDARYSPLVCETLRETSALLLGSWETVRRRIHQSLHKHLHQPLPIQYVLRDVHREHVLFSGDDVSGLIDFDAIRIDTPATDLARWGGSFLLDRADPDRLWEAVVAGFSLASPFPREEDHRHFTMLIRDLHVSSTWISLANWAVWIRLESRTFPAGELAIRGRIEQLCRLARQEL